jgi:hypothetical protein
MLSQGSITTRNLKTPVLIDTSVAATSEVTTTLMYLGYDRQQEIEKYKGGVASSGMTFISSFSRLLVMLMRCRKTHGHTNTIQ